MVVLPAVAVLLGVVLLCTVLLSVSLVTVLSTLLVDMNAMGVLDTVERRVLERDTLDDEVLETVAVVLLNVELPAVLIVVEVLCVRATGVLEIAMGAYVLVIFDSITMVELVEKVGKLTKLLVEMIPDVLVTDLVDDGDPNVDTYNRVVLARDVVLPNVVPVWVVIPAVVELITVGD